MQTQPASILAGKVAKCIQNLAKANAGQQFDVGVQYMGAQQGVHPAVRVQAAGGVHRENGTHEESVASQKPHPNPQGLNPVEQLRHLFDTSVVHSLCIQFRARNGTTVVYAGC